LSHFYLQLPAKKSFFFSNSPSSKPRGSQHRIYLSACKKFFFYKQTWRVFGIIDRPFEAAYRHSRKVDTRCSPVLKSEPSLHLAWPSQGCLFTYLRQAPQVWAASVWPSPVPARYSLTEATAGHLTAGNSHPARFVLLIETIAQADPVWKTDARGVPGIRSRPATVLTCRMTRPVVKPTINAGGSGPAWLLSIPVAYVIAGLTFFILGPAAESSMFGLTGFIIPIRRAIVGSADITTHITRILPSTNCS